MPFNSRSSNGTDTFEKRFVQCGLTLRNSPFEGGPPMGQWEQLFTFAVLFLVRLLLVGLCLPREWFWWAIKKAFPFLLERLEDLDKKD